jgi:hypothetical protein
MCTRNLTRKRLRDLMVDVDAHLYVNGPWPYKRAELYDEPAVTATVEPVAAEEPPHIAA